MAEFLSTPAFVALVAPKVGLTPGTCRVYLNQAGFKPAGGQAMKGRQYVQNNWLESQVDAAAAAIIKLKEERAHG